MYYMKLRIRSSAGLLTSTVTLTFTQTHTHIPLQSCTEVDCRIFGASEISDEIGANIRSLSVVERKFRT